MPDDNDEQDEKSADQDVFVCIETGRLADGKGSRNLPGLARQQGCDPRPDARAQIRERRPEPHVERKLPSLQQLGLRQ